MGFNLDDYEPVAERIDKFWLEFPDGRIITELTHFDEKRFIVKSSIWKAQAEEPAATGYAEELVGSTPVNKTSALENCETSAIGRALANLGYASKAQRPSREEMVKVASRNGDVQAIDEARNFTDRDQVCPDCGSDVYDNRDTNRQRKLDGKKNLPFFKCKNRHCHPDGDPWITWDASFFDEGDIERVDYGTGEVLVPHLRDEYPPDEAPF